MKRPLPLFIMLLLSFTSMANAQHFDPVDPTGLPWAIVVMSARIGDDTLAIGDEVAAFDGDLCVGAAIVDGDWPLAMTCWEGDPGFGLEGFTAGNPIQYRYWVNTPQVERADIYADYIDSQPFFGSGTHATTNLWAADLGVGDHSTAPPGSPTLTAYPNPFNATTSITLTLPVSGNVELELFDTLGRQVATLHHAPLSAGLHQFSWSGANLPSGIYFLRLHAPGSILQTQKLILLN